MSIFDGVSDNFNAAPVTDGQASEETGAESTTTPEGQETTVTEGQEGNESEGTSSEESEQEEGAESKETKPEIDYKKAYQSLLPEFTKKSQELSQLKKGQGQEGQEQSQMPKQSQESMQDQLASEMENWDQQTVDAFWEAMNENPGKTLSVMFNRMMEKAAPAMLKPYEADRQARELEKTSETVDKTMKALAVDYPSVSSEEGFKSLVTKAREIAGELGNADKASNPYILRMAAAELFPEDKAKVLNAVKQQGAEEVRNNIKAKNGAGVTTNSSQARKQANSKTPEDDIGDNIVASMRRGRGIF